jgi:hypothetical protein
VQFVIVDRKSFLVQTTPPVVAPTADEQAWVSTAGTFINTVNAAGYGDWLAGVMLIKLLALTAPTPPQMRRFRVRTGRPVYIRRSLRTSARGGKTVSRRLPFTRLKARST